MQSLEQLFDEYHRNRFTGILSLLIGVMMVAGLLAGAQPASAVDSGPTQSGEICMQKVFGTPVSNSNKLNCTANDIKLSKAISVSPNTCIAGATFNLSATFEVNVTANARYDAGFFFRTDGGTNARGDGATASGICSLSALNIPPAVPGLNLDGDTSGDLNAGTYSNVTFTIPGVLCQDLDGDGFLNLPNCTSWHSNQGTTCNINAAFDFDPDTKSKCVCDDTFQVPVRVETATLAVQKDVSPDEVPETGGTVTYTVQVTNQAKYVSVTITTLVDSEYGNIADPNNASITDNTCPGLVGDVLAPLGTTNCSFKAFVSGDSGATIPDTVEVCSTQQGTGAKVCGEDGALVSITDVRSTPTLTKAAKSAACTVDVNYQVVVSNNSAIDTLTVNSLTDDKFGDITQVQGNVVSTTCTNGSTIATSGNYTCSFVGRIDSDTCDINHVDTVTGGVTDDDGVTSSPSDSATVTITPVFP